MRPLILAVIRVPERFQNTGKTFWLQIVFCRIAESSCFLSGGPYFRGGIGIGGGDVRGAVAGGAVRGAVVGAMVRGAVAGGAVRGA
jgi:hypothetical protein